MKYRTRKTKNEIAILKNDKNWSSLPVASETKDSEKTETFSSEAYKNYLEAIFIWEKRENEADVLRSRKLLKRAIELDKNFLGARAWLAWTFLTVGEYDLAFDYFKIIEQDAEEIGDTRNLIRALHGLGEIYVVRDNNTKKGLSIFQKSLSLSKGSNKKYGLGIAMQK